VDCGPGRIEVTGAVPPRALILDYGNVLTFPQARNVIAAMASRVGSTVDAFHTAYWEHRHGYDLGDYPAPEYWRRVLTTLRHQTDETGEPELLDWLTARDGDSWMRYREAVWELALRARATRFRTAVLSNMSRELAGAIRHDRALDRWFDAVVVSAEVHCVKPDPRIYSLWLEQLGVVPERALFVDDRPENVRAAAALGIRTVHFQGDGQVATLRAAVGEGR
jgi:putative hydrolase of the HAD superfamily